MPTLLSIESLESDRLFVQRKLQEDVSPWGTARLMWENRLREIEEKIAEAISHRSNYASVALIFNGLPVIGQGDIRLDFSADALASYQKIIAASLAVQGDQAVAAKGKIKGAEKSKLFIRDIVRGSMGFLLEEVALPQADMFDTPLKNAVEKSTLLIAKLSQSSAEDFSAAIDATSPRLVGALQKFTKILRDAGATTKIVGDESRAVLGYEEINRLFERFSDLDVIEEEVLVEGTLLGILPDSHEFELQLPEGQGTLKGAVTDELASRYMMDNQFKERLLLKPVEALITYTKTFRQGKLIKQQASLDDLEPAIVRFPDDDI